MSCTNYALYLLFILVGLMFILPIQYCLFAFLFWSMFHMSQRDALYLSIFYSHSFLVYVLLVPQCLHCFGGFVNVTSVIKNFQQLWLWKRARKSSVFLCVLYFVCPTLVVVAPLCYMLRRFWAPTPDLASESDQLYSHVHSQSRWRVYNLNCIPMYCTFSVALTNVSTYHLKCADVHVSCIHL